MTEFTSTVFLNNLNIFCEKCPHWSEIEKYQEFKNLVTETDVCSILIQLISNHNFLEVLNFLKCIQVCTEVLKVITNSTHFIELLETVSVSKNQHLQCVLLSFVKYDASLEISDDGLSFLLNEAIQLMSSENIELANTAADAIEYVSNRHMTFVGRSLSLLLDRANANHDDSTVLLRYAGAIVKLLKLNDTNFISAKECGCTEFIVSLCRGSDVLVAMLAIDLLKDFAFTATGLTFLIEEGHVRWLMMLARGDENSAPDPLLGGQALQSLSVIFEQAETLHVEIWDVQDDVHRLKLGPAFLHAVMCHLEATDEASLLIGLRAISSFAASSVLSLRNVLQDEPLKDAWLYLIGRKPDLQSAALHTVAKVLEVFLDEDGSSATTQTPSDIPLSELKRSLFDAVGKVRNQSTVTYLLKLAKEPIPALKHAAFDIFRAIALQPSGWGLEVIFMRTYNSSDSPWQFLSDLSVEYEKKSKEWKFSVIEAIAKCPKKDFLNEEIQQEVQKRLSQGPFFAHARLAEPQTMDMP
eukprot:gene209-378_t